VNVKLKVTIVVGGMGIFTPICAIVKVCPMDMLEIDCPAVKVNATWPLAESLYTVKGVETWAEKFSFIALSKDVRTNFTGLFTDTVMLLSFGPGPVVLVAAIGTNPFCKLAGRTKAS